MRRKITSDGIRNIQKSKGSYHISIPMSIIRALGWKERQKVLVRRRGGSRVVIEDWKR